MYHQKRIGLNWIIFAIIGTIIVGCHSNVRFSNTKQKARTKQYNEQVNTYETVTDRRKTIINEAHRWIGTKYVYGGYSRKGVDCSGLTKICYSKAGINIPRTAAQQYKKSKRVTEATRKPGDLVFFRNSKKISHVGIYIGDGKFIHASSSKGVMIQRLSHSYYTRRYAGSGKFID